MDQCSAVCYVSCYACVCACAVSRQQRPTNQKTKTRNYFDLERAENDCISYVSCSSHAAAYVFGAMQHDLALLIGKFGHLKLMRSQTMALDATINCNRFITKLKQIE